MDYSVFTEYCVTVLIHLLCSFFIRILFNTAFLLFQPYKPPKDHSFDHFLLDLFFFSLICLPLISSSPESVIRRFEQRDYAVDSRGVAEYIRALVATNAIAEYLPDEQSGKPSSLPALVLQNFLQ